MVRTEDGKLTKTGKRMVGIIIVGGFITVLNQLVMSPALPTVMVEFGITPAVGQWLTSIFLLVNGLMVPVTAYLIARFTSRQIFTFAMIAFTAGSVVAAFSTGFSTLMLGRILQAIGAGVMLPFSMVTLMLIFPKERRGFALGLSGIVIGLAPAFGPTFAGYMVDEFGWRYIFSCLAPLAAVVCIIALIWLKNIGERKTTHLDWLSVVLSTVAFGGLLFGFSTAGSRGWVHPLTFIPIIVGAIVLVFFVRRQLHLPEPMLNLRVLKNPVFSVSTILSAIVSASLTVGAVLTPIYLQSVQGISALSSGLLLMPGALIMAGMSLVSGTLFDRIGPRMLSIIGLSGMTIGSLMLSFLDVHSAYLYVCFGYSLRSLGIAMVNMPVNTWGINQLPNSLIAHGNAINNTVRQVAGSIGTAILVTVMTIVSASWISPGAEATTLGINAAFRGATGLMAAGLIIAIIKVKGGRDGEDR
ncbi:MAG: multidrug efflux MFS transporter [Clostridiales Family XIII bacterium]|jgi:EmrB/QacA subfamily drug resistance transporter|nr:multidrug efflux MFS transporter [Clostridiales Family XIII bacterium]